MTHALALKHIITSTLRIYHISLVRLAGLNYLGWKRDEVRPQIHLLHRWPRVCKKFCPATSLLCTPHISKKNVCPGPALLCFAHCGLPPPFQGDHIHHCCLLWQHPTSGTAISLSTSWHWRAVKQCLENATPLAVTFIHCVVKSNPLWMD